MAVNQFVARNGIISLNDLQVTGSIYASGNVTAVSLIKSGGTSTQFLKADGSVDSNTYLTTSSASSTYVPYTGATGTVNLNAQTLTNVGALSGTSATFSSSVQATGFNGVTYKGSTYEFYVINNAATSNLLHHDGTNLYSLGQVYVGGNGFSTGTKLYTSGDNVSFGSGTFSSSVTAVSGIYVQAANNSDLPFINFSNNGVVYNWGRIGALLQGDGDGSLYFQTKLGGSLGTRLTISSTGAATFASTVYAGGDVVAYYSSDKYLKDNLTKIQSPLDKLSQINGYMFNWNNKQDTYEIGKEDLGVVAQEVEAILPQIVITRDNGYKAVKYEKLVPLLIEAIKEQQKQIDELKSQVNK